MVAVNNLSGLTVDKALIKKIAEVVLKSEKKISQDISIVLVDADKMKDLNQRYRRKNRLTDVLTFPELDIVVCPQAVKNNAKAAKATFKAELARVVIHGILHFLDYDHEAGEKEAEKMRAKEDRYFRNIVFNNK